MSHTGTGMLAKLLQNIAVNAADGSLEYKGHGQVPSLFGSHAISQVMIR